MHARDRLHHPAVTQAEAVAVHGLHASDVGVTVLRERNVRVALDGRGHAGRPQQFVPEMAINELVQVEQVLQQFPRSGERRRDQFDQRLGVVGRDVLVGQRRTELTGVRSRGKTPVRGHPQRLLLDALAAPLENFGLAAVDQGG